MPKNRIIVEDFVLFGRACPFELKNGKTSICSAGYSPTLGKLIRIYPMSIEFKASRWDIWRVPLERDPKDTREESWKIQGSEDDPGSFYVKIEKVGRLGKKQDQLHLISSLAGPCPQDLNVVKLSLGIVKPIINQAYFADNQAFDELKIRQKKLDEFFPTIFEHGVSAKDRNWVTTLQEHRYEPRIKWNCAINCRVKHSHDMKVLEWGFYEWIRKHPEKMDQVWENCHVNDPDWDIFFLVGNQRDRRTAFLIVSVFRFKK